MLLLLILRGAWGKRNTQLLLLLRRRLSPEGVRHRRVGERRRGRGRVALLPRQQRRQQVDDGAVELGRCGLGESEKKTSKEKKREGEC